ncbi:MAG: terminase large subunit domain-containing protein [Hyphomicrobium sp.]
MRTTCAARLRTVLSDSFENGGPASLLAELSPAELEFIFCDWQLWGREDQLGPNDFVIPGEPSCGAHDEFVAMHDESYSEPFPLPIRANARDGEREVGEASVTAIAEIAKRQPEGDIEREIEEAAATSESLAAPHPDPLPVKDGEREDAASSELFAPGGRLPAGESPGAIKRDAPAPSGRLAERESEGATKRVWLVLGGRGSGKTRAGAEWVRSRACGDGQIDMAPRIALVGKTIADVRNVMIEGPSGLLNIHRRDERPLFEPSKRRLTWPNGAVAEMFSADEREGLRGPQFNAAWCDEVAKWREAEKAWDMLQFALRLGSQPQVAATTPPRATAFLKKLMTDPATVATQLSTSDNADNLAPAFLAEMKRRYAGSAIGRQELFGEFVDDIADALWRRHWIEETRVGDAPEAHAIIRGGFRGLRTLRDAGRAFNGDAALASRMRAAARRMTRVTRRRSGPRSTGRRRDI